MSVPEKNDAPMKLCTNKKKEAIIEENIHHHNARPHWGVFKGKQKHKVIPFSIVY